MRTLYATAAATVIAGPALAHNEAGLHGSVAAGLAHPFLGTDHLLAMVAVGLLAATQSGVARWALPASFVAAIGAGIALGAAGFAMPFVEPAILASILILAALVAWAARLSGTTGATVMAFFGLAHGSAHGPEMGSAEALPYALGVLVATALLHAAGLGAGVGLSRLGRAGMGLRLLGAGLGVGALGIALG